VTNFHGPRRTALLFTGLISVGVLAACADPNGTTEPASTKPPFEVSHGVIVDKWHGSTGKSTSYYVSVIDCEGVPDASTGEVKETCLKDTLRVGHYKDWQSYDIGGSYPHGYTDPRATVPGPATETSSAAPSASPSTPGTK
jgi:hypothetical protein